jgi:hypothetical protein
VEAAKFNLIYENLKSRVDWCDEHLGPILCKKDLLRLTLEQYIELIGRCKTLKSEMDKIYAEWYHIIGMGNLSAVQNGKLFALIKRFSLYRSDIKCLADNASMDKIPDIPTSSKYKLTVLGDFTLTRESRGQAESEVDLSDAPESKAEITISDLQGKPEPAGKFDGKNIHLNPDEVKAYALWSGYWLTLKASGVADAIRAGKAYGGVQWMVKPDEYLGVPINEGSKNTISKLFAGQITRDKDKK